MARFVLKVDGAGVYESDTLWRIAWEIFTHRLQHLLRDGKWMD